ncbi:FtsX-like permease family protein [Streptomyces niveus]|uniref:FtsX-like permease family protein n=1 Tax=Streptomyces niveus TaxID=193462 RepID=UPI003675CF8E
MGLLAFRTLKFRKASFVATFVAMFLGAAIVMACGGLMETGIRMDAQPQRLSGAPIVVTGQQTSDSGALSERGRVDPALVDTVRGVPGVAKAVPDVSFPAVVVPGGAGASDIGDADGGSTAGHNWASASLAPYTLDSGAAPTGADEVVLDRTLAERADASVGSRVELAVQGVSHSYLVSGVVTRPGPDGDPAVFVSDDRARELTGGVDNIGVVPEAGASVATVTSAVKDAVGGDASVLAGERRGLAEAPGALTAQRTVIILAAVFGSWAVLVVLFGVASTLGLTLQQRTREMALLRSIGTTPSQLRRMILMETSVLSVIATALAVAPGYLLGKLICSILTDSGVLSPVIVFHQGWVPMLVGAATAVLAAAGATRFAGRKAARTEPVAALADSETNPRWFTRNRLLLALFFLTVGISLSATTVLVMENGPTLASTAGPASVFFSIGIALLAPGICAAVVAVLRLPVRLLTGLPGRLAVRNTATNPVRMASAAAPVIMLIAIATGTLYMQSTEDSVSARSYEEGISADYVLDSDAGGFRPEVAGQVAGLPGVAAASGLITSRGFVEADSGSADIALRGVDAGGVGLTLALRDVTGSLDALSGDTVALSTERAEKFGVAVGDQLPVRLGDGTQAKPKVVALFAGDPDEEFLLLPAGTLAAHTTEGLTEHVLVRADKDADLGALKTELASFVGQLPGAKVADSSTLSGSSDSIQQILVTANYTVVAMIVGYAAITVINTLVVVTRKRRREIGLSRLTGATRAQVFGMLSVEGALISVVAVVLGTAAAATTIVPYAMVKNDSYLPSGSVGIYLAVVGGSLLLIFGGTLFPSWRGMRTPPVETVAAE